MALELGQVDGIAVIPVNRVLAALVSRGLDTVTSPADGQAISRLVGADAILVFAVTHYDPYDPPLIGISAQLYGEGSRVLAVAQRVFDASRDSTVTDIKAFASRRIPAASPYGWREYVVNQQQFIKYCCYATLRDLLAGPSASVVSDAS